MNLVGRFVAAFVLVVAALFVVSRWRERPEFSSSVQAAPPAPLPQATASMPAIVPVAGAPSSFVALVKRAKASVVNIHSTAVIRQKPMAFFQFGEESPFYELLQPPERRARSLGTGFVITAGGDIVTNNHVIAPEELGGRVADEIVVTLEDKREFRAKVLSRDPPTDVALLHIDAPALIPIAFGDSDAVEVGEWVVAIGEPYGLSSTVTAGIVSAKGRHGDEIGSGFHRGYWDFIQTDCAINPGNSGGPLLNMRGEVIGINTAIKSQAQGLAFAVPTNMARRVIADLRRYGKVQRGWLGLRTIDPREIGVEAKAGVLIAAIAPEGPAGKGGLARGDLIVKFDGEAIASAEQFRWLSANAGVGKKVVLRVRRESKEADVSMTTIASP